MKKQTWSTLIIYDGSKVCRITVPMTWTEFSIKTILNGQVMQDWNTNDMIFDVPRLIEFLSGSTTLVPGTVILTGTPHGVGMARKPQLWLKHGDTVTVETTVLEARRSKSRPDVGIVLFEHTGTNQRGEVVLELDGAVHVGFDDTIWQALFRGRAH